MKNKIFKNIFNIISIISIIIFIIYFIYKSYEKKDKEQYESYEAKSQEHIYGFEQYKNILEEYEKNEKTLENTKLNQITWILSNYVPFGLGGSEVMAHTVNKHLIKKGFIINVIGKWKSQIYEGVNIIDINDIKNVKESINNSKIIFSQNYSYPEIAVRIAKKINKPVVIFTHTDNIHTDPNPEKYKNIINPSQLNIVYNSKWVKKHFNSSLNSFVLNPPVDCSKYKTDTNNKYVTLINLTKHKGGDIFIEIAKRMPDTKFLAVGNDNKYSNISNLLYLPKTLNMRDIYKETDILLMPSEKESWGMVATEALCSGIPVIATPTDGLKENLDYAGLFIERENIDEWVKMIYKLKNDRIFYNEISKKCKSRSKELYTNSQLDDFYNFINKI
jgi:glycosyltransferase involved in cell wall biosynthesis